LKKKRQILGNKIIYENAQQKYKLEKKRESPVANFFQSFL